MGQPFFKPKIHPMMRKPKPPTTQTNLDNNEQKQTQNEEEQWEK